MTRVGTLSIPGALLEGMAFIMSSTCLHSTKWNVNCSDVGKTLGVKMLLLKSKLFSSAKDSIFEFWLIFQQTQNIIESIRGSYLTNGDVASLGRPHGMGWENNNKVSDGT